MRIFDSLKKIKNFFVLIIPDAGAGSKSHKFSVSNIILVLSAYTVIVSIIGFLFFSITPVKNIFFSNEKFSAEEVSRIEELNKRMIFLSKELESLKSTNERLKYAIMLGDSALLESLYIKNDTLPLKKKAGGSILSVFRDFINLWKINFQESKYFIKPVNGFISREFDLEKGHTGIDFVAKKGTSIYSTADGYVVFSDYTTQEGNMMIINHHDGYTSVYKHCSVLLKKLRETVYQGELIALSGNSGEITTGPHLHFEIWKDGQPVNPINVFYNQ